MSETVPATLRPLLADAAGTTVTHLAGGEAPAIVTVDWAATVHRSGASAVALLGGTEPMGQQSLYAYLAPDEQAALHHLLTVAAAAPEVSPEVTLVARRTDGLPVVVRVSAPSDGRTDPESIDDARITLVLQRWGGPVVHEQHDVPPTPPRSGPDHLLSHDARGAIRNARNFGGIFARKLRSDTGEPIPGADGTPLSLDILDTSLRSVSSADAMLDRVVWFMRLETDPIAMGPVGVADLIEAGRRSARATGEELAESSGLPDLARPLDVHLDIAGPTGATVSVMGNHDLLTWCLAELFVNSRKFGGPNARVTVTVTPADRWVGLRVTSEGAGIDPALVEDAFKLGRMLQARGERPGVGMGLPLCRRIITRHGGRITAVPDPADAATFDLILLGSPAGDVR